jgi:GT2 family glycosyltransferase
MFENLRIIIVNFQTPDLLKISVESFRKFYPDARMTIIDNGSKDNSDEVIKRIQETFPDRTDVLILDKNIYHGPAMNYALNTLNEDYVFFIDSDTETKKGGFLEPMVKLVELSENAYAAGRQITVNKRGFLSEKGKAILTPAYMMLKRKLYRKFPPFEHHGQPVMKNFFCAQEKGYLLKTFPIENYIDHKWRGTASRFGYGLGIKGKIDFVLNKFGI